MPDDKPTVRSLDRRVGGLEHGLSGVTEALDRVDASILLLREDGQAQAQRLWDAMGSLGGLDGIGQGLADIAEVLAPVRAFAPASTAEPLDPGVAQTIGSVRDALGGDRRDLNFQKVQTRWDKRTRFIGEVAQPTDGAAR